MDAVEDVPMRDGTAFSDSGREDVSPASWTARTKAAAARETEHQGSVLYADILEHNRHLLAENEDLARKVEQMQRVVEAVRSNVVSGPAADSRIIELQAQVTHLAQVNQRLTQDFEHLRDRQRADREEHSRTVAEYVKQLDAAHRDNDELQAGFQRQCQELEAKQAASVQSFEAALADRDSRISRLEAEIAKHEDQTRAAVTDIAASPAWGLTVRKLQDQLHAILSAKPDIQATTLEELDSCLLEFGTAAPVLPIALHPLEPETKEPESIQSLRAALADRDARIAQLQATIVQQQEQASSAAAAADITAHPAWGVSVRALQDQLQQALRTKPDIQAATLEEVERCLVAFGAGSATAPVSTSEQQWMAAYQQVLTEVEWYRANWPRMEAEVQTLSATMQAERVEHMQAIEATQELLKQAQAEAEAAATTTHAEPEEFAKQLSDKQLYIEELEATLKQTAFKASSAIEAVSEQRVMVAELQQKLTASQKTTACRRCQTGVGIVLLLTAILVAAFGAIVPMSSSVLL